VIQVITSWMRAIMLYRTMDVKRCFKFVMVSTNICFVIVFWHTWKKCYSSAQEAGVYEPFVRLCLYHCLQGRREGVQEVHGTRAREDESTHAKFFL